MDTIDENLNVFTSSEITLEQKEANLLLTNGIHYLYQETTKMSYVFVKKIIFPIANGKCVYLISKGTNIAYILPCYVLEKYVWFKNALDDEKFKSNKIETPLNNYILSVDPPYPGLMKHIYNKILNGTINDYISDRKKKFVDEQLSYFLLDID